MSVDDDILEADEADDENLPPANVYSDSEDDSGDEWYEGLFDEVADEPLSPDQESQVAENGMDAIAAAEADEDDADDEEEDDEEDDEDDDEDMDLEDMIDEADIYNLLTVSTPTHGTTSFFGIEPSAFFSVSDVAHRMIRSEITNLDHLQAFDSELVEYKSIPPRVFPTVQLSKAAYGKEPTLCQDGDLWTYLTAIVKERNAYFKMGPTKRAKPAGRNRNQRIQKMVCRCCWVCVCVCVCVHAYAHTLHHAHSGRLRNGVFSSSIAAGERD